MLMCTFSDLFDHNLRQLAQQAQGYPEAEMVWMMGRFSEPFSFKKTYYKLFIYSRLPACKRSLI